MSDEWVYTQSGHRVRESDRHRILRLALLSLVTLCLVVAASITSMVLAVLA